MKNLLERLKPEIKAVLDEEAVNYPNIAAEMRTHLTKTEYISDLRYHNAILLESYYYIAFNTRPFSAFDCFLDN